MNLGLGIFLLIFLAILAGITTWLALSVDGWRLDRQHDHQQNNLASSGKLDPEHVSVGIYWHANWFLGALTFLLFFFWWLVADALWSSQGQNLHPVWTWAAWSFIAYVVFFFGFILTERILRRSARTHVHAEEHGTYRTGLFVPEHLHIHRPRRWWQR